MPENLDFPSLTRELFVAYENYLWHSVLDLIFINSYKFLAEFEHDSRIVRFNKTNPNHASIAEMMTIALEHCDALEELQVPQAIEPPLLDSWLSIKEIFSSGVSGSYVEVIRGLMRNHSKVYNDALGLIGLLYAAIDNPGHKGKIGDASDIMSAFESHRGLNIDQCFKSIMDFVFLAMRERPADQRFIHEFDKNFKNFLMTISQDIEDVAQLYRPHGSKESTLFLENITLTQGVLEEAPSLLEEYLVTAPISL